MSILSTFIVAICFLFLGQINSETTSEVEPNSATVSTPTEQSISTITTAHETTSVASTTTDENDEEPNTIANGTNMDTTESVNTSSSDIEISSEDFGTVIESDIDATTTLDQAETGSNNETVRKPNGTENTATTESSSVKEAIKDIAYYLRTYKFNEYDRRYERNGTNAPRRFFKEFPRPPLRSLHWEVHKYCEPSFLGCVEFLAKRIRYIALKRGDDTAVVMQEQNWTLTNNSEQITQVDKECKKLRTIGNVVAEPFQGPLERFQWRVTASYYMCWYSMQEVPELRHLLEPCDNFADCLDQKLGPNNKDVRANDSNPYACALYSFCPDICCPMKHLSEAGTCWDSNENPCFLENPPGQRECSLNRSSNVEFRDIVLNRWNVTCRCASGYVWNSRYGMCVDVDECAVGRHNCKREEQACVNLAGSFRCACAWGNIWSTEKKKCVPSEALRYIKLSHKQDRDNNTEKSESLIRRLTKFFRRNSSNAWRADKIAVFSQAIVFAVMFTFVLK